jgi:hypothetical protein
MVWKHAFATAWQVMLPEARSPKGAFAIMCDYASIVFLSSDAAAGANQPTL